MVKNKTILLFSALLAVLFVGTQVSADIYDEDEDGYTPPEMHPLNIPPITEIEITNASADVSEKGADRGSLDCSQFSVTEKDIKDYFGLARRISENDYMHTISWVPCQAFGQVRFIDGTSATWSIMLTSGGTLSFSDGETVYLFCDRCIHPFVPS